MSLRTAITAVFQRFRQNARPALDGLDDQLATYLDHRNGFFIEAGANDGRRQSNSYFLEKKRGWRGLLVEGIPDLHRQCVKNRPASKVVNRALAANDYAGESVIM